MKVRIYGFEWSITSGATVPQFIEYLRTRSGQETEGENHVLGIARIRHQDPLWAGVLLTIKDQRTYAELKRRARGFEVSPRELERNTNIVDFNFFVVNEHRGRGLYQYYHHSAALSFFRSFCKQRFRAYQSINEIKRGQFGLDVIMRRASIEDCINELRRIRAIEFEAVSFNSSQAAFRPLTDLAQRQRHRYVFFKRAADRQHAIKEYIIGLVRGNKLKSGRIEGYDADGIERVYDLFNDPDRFAEYEYDDFVRTVHLDTGNLDATVSQSYVVRRLVDLYNQEDINPLLTMEAG